MVSKNLQVRLDDRLKKRAENVFKKIGIDAPTAIRIFFIKVADMGGIPFLLQSPDGEYTPKQITAIDAAAAKAKRGKGLSRAFSSVEELLDDLHSR
ncbi:MAG: type II toxin-antitoxin system RelB/DinJ family antitoxin [Candidatus Peribacteraceae bacterium]|nr:type II toxin-antitoxin system RelB/DinJ family antitoxin [Candidatus Peribacteraceae bacterium]